MAENVWKISASSIKQTMEGGETASNEEANNILSQIKEAEEVKQVVRNGLCSMA